VSYIKSIPTRYGGRTYRSRCEARWAAFFDGAGIKFSYEAEGFGLGRVAYLPDFWLPDWQMFFEVKGQFPTGEEQEKCELLACRSGKIVLLATGEPEERFQLQWYDENGCDERLYVIARDRNVAAGHWLVSDDLDMARPIHDGPLGTRRLGPMFSGGLEEAYHAAASLKFDQAHRQPRIEKFPDDPDRGAHHQREREPV
jgi:hypothetical protein